MPDSPSRYGITVPFDGVTLRDHRRWFTELVELGYTDVWSAEVDGADGFTPLALAAAWEPALNLGVAIAPAYTRGPALLAQTAAAMAEAAPGRFALGLGASSEVIVQRWNAVDYVDPFHRVRDTLRFLRAAFAGEKVTADYEYVRGGGVPPQPPGRSSAGLPGRAPGGDAAPGRPGGRRRRPQLAVGRRRGHVPGRGRSGQGGRGPHLRRPDRRRRRWPARSVAAWSRPT